MVAKVKTLDMKRIKKKFDKKIDSIATNKGLMKGIAKFSLVETKKYVRLGISPKTDEQFPVLEPSTIRTRDSFDKNKKGRKSPYFIPDFSNLTMTGQLVSGMKITYNKEKRALLMSFKNSRKSSNLTNEKLVKYLSDMGRFIVGSPKHVKPKIIKAIYIFLDRRKNK